MDLLDLNLFPNPLSSSSTRNGVASTFPLLTPKVEPKLEPLDESELLRDSCLIDSESPYFLDSQCNHSTSSDAAFLLRTSAEEDNVYSEFSRISEAFRNAFAKKCGDCDVLGPESGAIVPALEESMESQMPMPSMAVYRKKTTRPRELVRVGELGFEDQRYFRELVRKTRMAFDSLRIFTMVEAVKRGVTKHLRGDMRASSIMREGGLWLNRDKKIVGSVPGVYIGDIFFFRMELCVVGLHTQTQAGIDTLPASHSSNGEPIATSIIVSGGYEDDEDGGDVIIYTGQGGQDKFSKQCSHQKLTSGNLALERSMHYGIELRVIRGFKYDGSITGKVYVYDGLYTVVCCWFDVGRSGFGVYKYKLVRIDGQPEMGSSTLRFAENLRTNVLSAKPPGYISLDISKGKENVPVLLFNDIDDNHQPMYYDYVVKALFPHFISRQGSYYTGCSCSLTCTEDCHCAMKNGGLAYASNGILLRGKPLIFECGSLCQCPPTCRNRVSQRGIHCRLEVFRSRETGWGVRSLDLIPAGEFICEYSGLVLTKDLASVLAMNGDSLVYPSRFTKRWAEWGDLSQIYADYVQPSHPYVPPLDFAMDVSSMRNVACYMSHSLTPNVFVQFVLYDHENILFPHLMLFAMENIPPLRELSLDYGISNECPWRLEICN